jgi:hypothetical protein
VAMGVHAHVEPEREEAPVNRPERVPAQAFTAATLTNLQRTAGNRATSRWLAGRRAIQRQVMPLSEAFKANDIARNACYFMLNALGATEFGQRIINSETFQIQFELVPTKDCPADDRAGNTMYVVCGTKSNVEVGRDLTAALDAAGEPKSVLVNIQLFERNLQALPLTVQVLAHELTAHGVPLERYLAGILGKHKQLQAEWARLVEPGSASTAPGPLSEEGQHEAVGRGENAEYLELHKVIGARLRQKQPQAAKSFEDAQALETEVFGLREQKRRQVGAWSPAATSLAGNNKPAEKKVEANK